jgi:hypothetical protein
MLIRFSPEHPKNLERHLIGHQNIKNWPGGVAQRLRIWNGALGE